MDAVRVMMLVRFRRTFRHRAPEWVLAIILCGWGGVLLLPGNSFDRPFFRPLYAIATEDHWGLTTTVIGVARVGALLVNGSRPRATPRIRMIGSFFGMIVWSLLMWGALSVEWHSPAIFTYAGLFALEGIMLSYSSSDASRGDREAVRGRG